MISASEGFIIEDLTSEEIEELIAKYENMNGVFSNLFEDVKTSSLSGETLADVADRVDVSLSTLLEVNPGISQNQVLVTGTEIILSGQYLVDSVNINSAFGELLHREAEPGRTVTDLAVQWDTTLQDIFAVPANSYLTDRISSDNSFLLLQPGETITPPSVPDYPIHTVGTTTLNLDNLPGGLSSYDYANLAVSAYGKYTSFTPSGWYIASKSEDLGLSIDGYRGVAYVNENTKEIIFAHKGTDSEDSFVKDDSLRYSYSFRLFPSHMYYAERFVNQVTSLLYPTNTGVEADDYAVIAHTGHSVGAAIAESMTFKTGVPTVSFDSIGSKELLQSYLNGSSALSGTTIDNLGSRVIAFNSAPSLGNTSEGSQVAKSGNIYRIYPEYAISSSSILSQAYKDFSLSQTRLSDAISQCFNDSTGKPRVYYNPTSWPTDGETWFHSYALNPHYWDEHFTASKMSLGDRIAYIDSDLGGFNPSHTTTGVQIFTDGTAREIFGTTIYRDYVTSAPWVSSAEYMPETKVYLYGGYGIFNSSHSNIHAIVNVLDAGDLDHKTYITSSLVPQNMKLSIKNIEGDLERIKGTANPYARYDITTGESIPIENTYILDGHLLECDSSSSYLNIRPYGCPNHTIVVTGFNPAKAIPIAGLEIPLDLARDELGEPIMALDNDGNIIYESTGKTAYIENKTIRGVAVLPNLEGDDTKDRYLVIHQSNDAKNEIGILYTTDIHENYISKKILRHEPDAVNRFNTADRESEITSASVYLHPAMRQ